MEIIANFYVHARILGLWVLGISIAILVAWYFIHDYMLKKKYNELFNPQTSFKQP
jgi:hypothetical protein